MITISNMLQILPNDMVKVPGLEPPSSVSSPTYAAHYSLAGVENNLVHYQDALVAIPGSEVVHGVNYGMGGVKQRWFKLPPHESTCPCTAMSDYYKILRNIPKRVEPDAEPCPTVVQEFCNDNTDYVMPSPPDTYFDDKERFAHIRGRLPLISPYLDQDD